MTMIDVPVKGYKIYCVNHENELYDFFVPNKQYRMSEKEAEQYVPEMHQVIAVKRDTKHHKIRYEDLIELQNK